MDKKAAQTSENVIQSVKDAQLDKKAAKVAETSGIVLSNAFNRSASALKEAGLDTKLSAAGGEISKVVADAKLPEKLFEAANIIPGVTVKNPKKAAKEFRRKRTQAIKKAGEYQRQMSKRFNQAAPPKKGFPWFKTALGTAGGLGLGYAGLAANNERIWKTIGPLTNRLPGEAGQHYATDSKYMTFYKFAGADKEGTPVVFVHGIGAGNSSYEWLKNFGPVAERHPAYAYDLIGFGNSSRPDIRYTAEVYIRQLTDFLEKVVKQPAYIVASSLSASYAVQVAYRHPELVKKLVLVTPTGLNREAKIEKVQILPGFTYGLLRAPVLGRAIYSGVAARSSIRSFLETQLFFDKSFVTEEMVEQYYTSAHQRGAEYAPPSFFTGLLNAEIGNTISKIAQPILMVFGKDSQITPLDEGETLKRENPKARLEIIARAKMLVQWEQDQSFNRLALDFLEADQPAQSAKRNNGTQAAAVSQSLPQSSPL